MKDFVSDQWISVVTFVASVSVLCAIFAPYGFPWMGPVWVSLAFSAAVGLALTSTRSIRQVIHGVEIEPGIGVGVPERLAKPMGGVQLRFKREGTS